MSTAIQTAGEPIVMSWREGRRVVDLGVLAKSLRCKQCGGLLDLEKTEKEIRMGLASLLYITCSCGLTNIVHTGAQQLHASGKMTYIINMIASANMLQCGVLAYVVQNFFAALNIPLPAPPFDDVGLDSSSNLANPEFTESSADVEEPTTGVTASASGNTVVQQSVPGNDPLTVPSEHQNNLWPGPEENYKQEDCHADVSAVKSDCDEDQDGSYPVMVTFQQDEKPSTAPELHVPGDRTKAMEVPHSGVTVPAAETSHIKTVERVQVQNMAVIINTSSTDKPFGCGVCFKAYRSEELCQAHIQTHIGEKPFLCDECGKGFVCKYNLKLHMKQHTGERPHRCFICGKGFIREFTLKRHMMKHKGHTPFTCTQCGEGFSSHESLKRHGRLHTGEKPFKCDQCDKRFRGESNLYAHRRRHFGIKPYKCQDCGAAFVESTHLTRHRRTHTGEQPYICEICGVRYTQSGTLAAHRKKHTGEPKTVKILQCADCGKIFHSYTQLKRHKRVHTGEKPYVCDYCNMAFTQSSSLKAHRRIHTGERPFSCDQCGESFLYPRTLKRHKKKHMEACE